MYSAKGLLALLEKYRLYILAIPCVSSFSYISCFVFLKYDNLEKKTCTIIFLMSFYVYQIEMLWNLKWYDSINLVMAIFNDHYLCSFTSLSKVPRIVFLLSRTLEYTVWHQQTSIWIIMDILFYAYTTICMLNVCHSRLFLLAWHDGTRNKFRDIELE